MATFAEGLFRIRSNGEGSDIQQRQFLLPAGILQVIGFDEGQAVAVEHEPDVDEEDTIARAAIEKLLFE